jgi:flagellar motor component MotA
MERNEIIDVLNGMCERCLMRGIISTLDEAKTLCEVFDRFRNNSYTNDEVYSSDIMYLYNLAGKLHKSGNTSLEESYSIYSAILAADKIDFVETDEPLLAMTLDEHPVETENNVEVKPVKIKRSKKSKKEDGVVDISDISF